jgi:hypothetical protein
MLYAIDLYRLTVTPAFRPIATFTLSFVKTAPNKHQVQDAIHKTINELSKQIEQAEKDDEDGIAAMEPQNKLEIALRAMEIIKNTDWKFPVPTTTQPVDVAKIQIGSIKFEVEEVWIEEP